VGWRFPLLLVCSGLALGACQSIAPPPPAQSAIGKQASAQFQGRFSANIDKLNDAFESTGRENVPGRFEYTQQNSASLLELYSPFGQLMARFTSPAVGEVTLETANRGTFKAKTADELADQALGWRVPITRLPEWLQGRASKQGQIDIDGRLLTDVDANWRVVVEEWSPKGQPLRMTLRWPESRTGLGAHNAVVLKLIVQPSSL
jgi:outer membrane lipoprotein LolB